MMKKYFTYFILFVFALFISSVRVDAKSYSDDNISLEFGKDNVLNLNYQGYKEYGVDDNEFYYNGNLYSVNSDIKDGDTLLVEGETLTYNATRKVFVGENLHEFYGFHIDLEIKSNKVYTFSQMLCYKYDDVSRCSEDKGDEADVTRGRYSHNFFYSFLPFYDEEIEFDHVYFNLKFVNKNNPSEVIEVDEFGFDINEGDIINYKDSFVLEMNDYGGNHTYNGKDYIFTACMSHYFDADRNQEVVSSISDCENNLGLTLRVMNYSNDLVNLRNYKISFDIYTKEDYSSGYSINNDDIYVVKTGYYNSFLGPQEYYYLEKFDAKLQLENALLLYIPLDNIIEFNKEDYLLSDESFKLDLKYVCLSGENSDCNDSRANQSEVVNSYIYHFDIDDPVMDNELIEGVKLPGFTTIAGQNQVSIKINVKDLNGIDIIEYFVSKNASETGLATKTYTQIENGNTIIVDEEGFSYIYIRVKENSKETFVYFNPQEILIDDVSPSMISNNFNSYKEDETYSNVNLTINYRDDNLEIAYTQIKSKAYYKIIKESEKESVTSTSIVSEGLLYSNGVKLDKTTISEDGKHLVCFVLEDYLTNKSDKFCSLTYDIDVTALKKEEVSASSSEDYVSSVKTIISIDGVSDGVSFKCGLSKVTINSQNELGGTCYNNKEATLKVSDEAIYHLWIYASDKVGNYNLIRLDNEFYIDSLAPRVTTSITGDNTVYSNNVKVDVSVYDLNQDDVTLEYQFYLSSPSSGFTSFDIDEGITYPYDYYGSYKLAIRACDVLNNCGVYTDSTSYLIDTAKILISLIGEDKISILQYQKYIELGASASKGNAGKYKVELDYKVSGRVDNTKPGVYVITYTAGEGMNEVSITREIEVKSSKYYIISLVSLFVIGEAIILARLFIKKRKNDNI